MSAAAVHPGRTLPSVCHHPGELVRVYVWEWPVRMTHWCTAYSILVLAATGFYIGHPFVTVSGPAGDHFVMGWVKTIHSYTAIVFALTIPISALSFRLFEARVQALKKRFPYVRPRPEPAPPRNPVAA